jgi:hypothetical protein
MAKTTKHIVGASRGKKKGFPRRHKKMPKYPGGRNRPTLPDVKPMPMPWEDRNRDNNGSKLNP